MMLPLVASDVAANADGSVDNLAIAVKDAAKILQPTSGSGSSGAEKGLGGDGVGVWRSGEIRICEREEENRETFGEDGILFIIVVFGVLFCFVCVLCYFIVITHT